MPFTAIGELLIIELAVAFELGIHPVGHAGKSELAGLESFHPHPLGVHVGIDHAGQGDHHDGHDGDAPQRDEQRRAAPGWWERLCVHQLRGAAAPARASGGRPKVNSEDEPSVRVKFKTTKAGRPELASQVS